MPELPEVEVLRRHLRPVLRGRVIQAVHVLRERSIHPTRPAGLKRALTGARIGELERRGKFLLFHLRKDGRGFRLLGHLGMTGRMHVQPRRRPLPEHARVHLELSAGRFVFEDIRCFGRLTLDLSAIDRLGPEPLSGQFTAGYLRAALRRCGQAIKVKLLDQSLLAGLGNIYASEALFRAGIGPRKAARRLTRAECERLHGAIGEVLEKAIRFGSAASLDFSGQGRRDGLFYFGRAADGGGGKDERLRVYDREGEGCVDCGQPIRRIVQAARATYYCPRCQG